MLILAAQSADRAKTPLLLSQRIVQFLYKTTSPLGRELYVALLEQLCNHFDNVAKEAIPWLIYSEDEVSDFIFLYGLRLNQLLCRGSSVFLRSRWHSCGVALSA